MAWRRSRAHNGIAVVNKMVRHRVAVAAGTAQADDVPDIDNCRGTLWKQQGAQNFTALRGSHRFAVRITDRHVRAQPGRVMAAAGEVPNPTQPKAIRYLPELCRAGRAPSDNAVRGTKDFLGHIAIKVGRDHRAAISLL